MRYRECENCGIEIDAREVVTRCTECKELINKPKTEIMKIEGTVTIPLEEYKNLTKLKDNYYNECEKFAKQIHERWAKSEVYWEAIKRKEAQNENENEISLRKNIEHWKKHYFSLQEKVVEHNKKFYTFNKIKI
jgi:predicted RNase H-like nuclease (RuvC/YqgF family)